MRAGARIWFVDNGKVYFGIINEEHVSYCDISSKSRQHTIPHHLIFYTEKDAKARLSLEGKKQQNWFIRQWNWLFEA